VEVGGQSSIAVELCGEASKAECKAETVYKLTLVLITGQRTIAVDFKRLLENWHTILRIREELVD
jgi:hypothetical protein